MSGYARANANEEVGTYSSQTNALQSQGEEVIEYAGMDVQMPEEDEGEAGLYAEEALLEEDGEEVTDYTGMDEPAGEAEEVSDDPYMEEPSEEDWEEEYKKKFYEEHKEMDFDGDGEITRYETSRWDFIHADLEEDIAGLKPLGQQCLYLDRYLLAYMEMDMDEYEQLSKMERADRMDAAYAQMCSDRNMTMDELEEIFETELGEIVQEIRESDPHI